MVLTVGKGKTVSIAGRARGPWDSSLEQLFEWDPGWAETCVQMTTNPWTRSVLPRKTVELISIALSAACTNLNHDGTRLHIHAALEAGATREEILMVLKMASLLSIHSCSVGAPILSGRSAGSGGGTATADGGRRAHPGLRCHAGVRTMEPGMGPLFRTRSGMD